MNHFGVQQDSETLHHACLDWKINAIVSSIVVTHQNSQYLRICCMLQNHLEIVVKLLLIKNYFAKFIISANNIKNKNKKTVWERTGTFCQTSKVWRVWWTKTVSYKEDKNDHHTHDFVWYIMWNNTCEYWNVQNVLKSN